MEGTLPGDALRPPPQRATPARKGARCGAAAGSPRLHRPHPGHTGHRAPAARPRGRAAGGGTAPDTRRPSQRWQAIPPGDAPPPPLRHAAPTGHADQGDSVGPPHPHTRAHSTWLAGLNIPPSGRAVGGGGAPDLRHPSQRWKAPPPGDALPPPSQRATPACNGARCGTGAGCLRPHGPHPEHTGRGTPAARPRGRAVGGGTAPDTRRPSQQWQAPPPAARSPHRACRPSQVGGNRHRTAPPPKHARRSKGPGQDTRRGTDHVERPYQRPVPGPREVRTPHHPGGGGADTAGARGHIHAKGTRGLQEGQPDQARGTHRPRGMAYQRARVRDTRTGWPPTRSAGHAGRDGGNGRDRTPGTGPSRPNGPLGPRTHRQGTPLAKAVVAHRATPQPLGYAASAPAQGGPTGDKPVARARRRRRPGRPRIRGATQWVSARSHGCELMH